MKMKRKNIIIVLSILFGLQIVFMLFFQLFSAENVAKRSYKTQLVKGLKQDQIVSIKVSDKSDMFFVEKKETEWFVKAKEQYIPGNQILIKEYLEILETLPQGVVVDKGEKSVNDAKYGFDEESFVRVEVQTDRDKSFSLIVGSKGSGNDTAYIRFNDEKKVREVNSKISFKTRNTPIDWANKFVFDTGIKSKDVQKMEVSSYGLDWYTGNFVVQSEKSEDEKQSEAYEIIPPVEGSIKKYVLKNMVQSLLDLVVYEYKLDKTDLTDREKLAELKLTLKNDTQFTLNIYPKDENDVGDYIVTVDFSNYQYLVTKNNIKGFIKSYDLLQENKE